MKLIAASIGLATVFSSNVFAGGSLCLKLEPDRDYLLNGPPREVVVKIDLSAIDQKRKLKRTPLNLAVVLDRSGSMAGAKLEKARQAAMGLVDQLGDGDVFAFITYSDRAEVVCPAQVVEDKEWLKSRIARVNPAGSTALYAGVELGAEEIRKHLSGRRINRVILLSDGLANVGPSSPAQLRQLGSALSAKGIAVTTIGVGDDYNEDLMAGLAEASDANYYYVKDTEKLPSIFARELGELRTVAARGVRIEITCPEGVKPLGFIGRPERFSDQKAALELNQFTLSQNRYVFVRCLVNRERAEVARVKVRYTDELNGGADESLEGIVKIGWTDDAKLAESSNHAGLIAQKELLLSAVTKDEALVDADAGQYQRAAQKLARQAGVLEEQYKNAPAAVQSQLRQEAVNLRQRSDQLQKNQYDSSSRKSLQWESFNTRNSK